MSIAEYGNLYSIMLLPNNLTEHLEQQHDYSLLMNIQPQVQTYMAHPIP